MEHVWHQRLIPVLPWSHPHEWLFRSINKLPESTMALPDVESILHTSTETQIAFPSHVFEYPWVDQIQDFCSITPSKYSWQFPVGESLLFRLNKLTELALAGMKVELLLLRAPSLALQEEVNNLLNISVNFKLVFLASAIYSPTEELAKLPAHWLERLRVCLVEKVHSQDPFLTEVQSELARLHMQTWLKANGGLSLGLNVYSASGKPLQPSQSQGQSPKGAVARGLVGFLFYPLFNFLVRPAQAVTILKIRVIGRGLAILGFGHALVVRSYHYLHRQKITLINQTIILTIRLKHWLWKYPMYPFRKIYYFTEYQLRKRLP